MNISVHKILAIPNILNIHIIQFIHTYLIIHFFHEFMNVRNTTHIFTFHIKDYLLEM